jgi:hypothetical protein
MIPKAAPSMPPKVMRLAIAAISSLLGSIRVHRLGTSAGQLRDTLAPVTKARSLANSTSVGGELGVHEQHHVHILGLLDLVLLLPDLGPAQEVGEK